MDLDVAGAEASGKRDEEKWRERKELKEEEEEEEEEEEQ
jgi:ribosomal protein L12E/L44/L45/RPP1/RPP2